MTPFERQVNFSISAEDFPLLEAARAEYGTIKGGILAGLRLLAQQRLERADAPAPSPLPSPLPSPSPPAVEPARGALDWWMDVQTVADTFGRSPATVRKWVAEGRATGRGEGRALEVDIATVQLERAPAAEWIGVKSATLRKWTEEGKVQATPTGFYLFGELELPLSRALDRWDFSASERASLEKRGHQTPRGKMVLILDAVELSGSETATGTD